MMVYIAELSTPFLNASWLINYLNFESSTPLMTCGGILVVSFFFCRVLWGPFMLWHMMNNWVAPPRFLYYINVFIVIFFILLNFYWFYLLLRLLLGKKKEKHTWKPLVFCFLFCDKKKGLLFEDFSLSMLHRLVPPRKITLTHVSLRLRLRHIHNWQIWLRDYQRRRRSSKEFEKLTLRKKKINKRKKKNKNH